MSDDSPITISEGDLRDSADNPTEMFEQLRSVTMDEDDTLQAAENASDVDFIERGRLETIQFISGTFAAVKAGRDDSGD